MENNLKEMLEREVEIYGKAGHPALMQRFVLKVGHQMTPLGKLPVYVERGQAKQCFMNATHLMNIGYRYVEGYVLVPHVPLAIHHAWVLDPAGNVIDNTLRTPEEAQYFGVEFDERDVMEEMLKSGVYGILCDDMAYNTDLMFRKMPELQDVIRELNLEHQKKFR